MILFNKAKQKKKKKKRKKNPLSLLGDLPTTPNPHGQATADEGRAPAVRRRAQRRAAQSEPGHLDATRTRRR